MIDFLNIDEVENLSTKIVRAALESGADEASVVISGERTGLSRFSKNQIIQNVEKERLSATLAVSIGRHEAAVSSDILSDAGIKKLAGDCIELAGMYPENPEHVSCIGPQKYEVMNCFDRETAEFSPEQKAQLIDSVCVQVERENLLAYGTFTTGYRVEAVANSNGLFAFHPESRAQFSLTVRTENQKGSCREARSHHRLGAIDIPALTQTTMATAARSDNPRTVDPGDYTVILSPTAATNYLMFFFLTLDARKVDQGRSALVSHFGNPDPVNRRLFHPDVSIRSKLDPARNPRQHFGRVFSMEGFAGQGMASTIFSTGLPVQAFPIVEKGVLKNLVYPYYWAKKKNRNPVAFPSLIEFSGTEKTQEDLIKNTERGLLINSLWYIRMVDSNDLLLTGLTRDGVFLIEDGEVVCPVKNLRFNESPLISLGNIQEIGRTERRQAWFTTVLMPTLKIADFTFSVQTDAV